MSKIDDGGPAFPTSNGYPRPEGMSLRDFFAGQALAAIVNVFTVAPLDLIEKSARGEGFSGPLDDYMAFRSYRIADAMLAERKKGGAA